MAHHLAQAHFRGMFQPDGKKIEKRLRQRTRMSGATGVATCGLRRWAAGRAWPGACAALPSAAPWSSGRRRRGTSCGAGFASGPVMMKVPSRASAGQAAKPARRPDEGMTTSGRRSPPSPGAAAFTLRGCGAQRIAWASERAHVAGLHMHRLTLQHVLFHNAYGRVYITRRTSREDGVTAARFKSSWRTP